MWDALDPEVMLTEELVERRQAGFDVSSEEQTLQAALDDGSPELIEEAYLLLEATKLRQGWPLKSRHRWTRSAVRRHRRRRSCRCG